MNPKLQFLQNEFLQLLKEISLEKVPHFGKMNLHQMIEHMAWSFQIASGKIHFPNTQTEIVTDKMYRFMISDKPFRENTPNPNMAETPKPTDTATIPLALEWLQNEIDNFVLVYQQNDNLRIANPFFGELNFEEQVHLLHKHALHHLKQFGQPAE